MLVQARGYFPHTFAVFVAMMIGALVFLLPEDVASLVLPAFLVSEPGMLGVMAVAAHRLLEVDSGSVTALQVSPLRSQEYVLGLVLGSAFLATLAGAVTFAAVAGINGRLAWLILVLFPFSVLSGLLGFVVSLRYDDFPRFVLGSIPAVAVWQAPLLGVFDLIPSAAVAWIPSAPGIFAMAALCQGEVSSSMMLVWSGAGLSVAGAGLVLVQRYYQRRLEAGWVLT